MLLFAASLAGIAFVVITLGLCRLLDWYAAKLRRELDARYEERRIAVRRRTAVARSRALHPSSSVRVIRTRPFDFDRDAR